MYFALLHKTLSHFCTVDYATSCSSSSSNSTSTSLRLFFSNSFATKICCELKMFAAELARWVCNACSSWANNWETFHVSKYWCKKLQVDENFNWILNTFTFVERNSTHVGGENLKNSWYFEIYEKFYLVSICLFKIEIFLLEKKDLKNNVGANEEVNDAYMTWWKLATVPYQLKVFNLLRIVKKLSSYQERVEFIGWKGWEPELKWSNFSFHLDSVACLNYLYDNEHLPLFDKFFYFL